MRTKNLFFIMMSIMLLSACGKGMYLPSHAIDTAEGGISIPLPANFEKQEVKNVTSIVGALDPGLFTEAVGTTGVWPVGAMTTKGELIKGFAYLLRVNDYGTWLVNVVFLVDKTELAGAKMLMFNRDAGWAYSLKGIEIGLMPSYRQKDTIKYDPEMFDKEGSNYRQELFKAYGDTIEELNKFWYKYYEAKGRKEFLVKTCAKSYVVGSPEWEKYKQSVSGSMPNAYKMPNGEMRIGKMETDEFRDLAIDIPGYTPGERFVKNTNLPLASLPFSSIALLFGSVGVADNAVKSFVDVTWSGFSDRAQVFRKQLAPSFRAMNNAHELTLFKLNMENDSLRRENETLRRALR